MRRIAALALASLIATGATAQTVKIGVVNTFTGPAAAFGEMTDRAFKLY
jgi:ABC-type branched-subunit amino acid transport system substrate-binding protein